MTQRRTRYPGPIAEAKTHAHTLIEQGFAEDAALAAVLDRYPAELFDINLYDYDDEGQVFLRTGARGRLSGLLIGADVGRSLQPIADEIDVPSFMRGVRVVLEKGKPLIAGAEVEAIKAAFVARQQQKAAQAADRNIAEGAKLLADNKTQKGVITTRSGLQYQVIRPGSGARPMPGATVRVNYEGRLPNGTVFDSSYKRGEPAEFSLNQVIPGWREGVALMPVGGKYRFWVPGELAYGKRGSPPNIGPNQVLVFDVELMDILK